MNAEDAWNGVRGRLCSLPKRLMALSPRYALVSAIATFRLCSAAVSHHHKAVFTNVAGVGEMYKLQKVCIWTQSWNLSATAKGLVQTDWPLILHIQLWGSGKPNDEMLFFRTSVTISMTPFSLTCDCGKKASEVS
eukprot:6176954-Pleurochrysis_carterae.AAC.4